VSARSRLAVSFALGLCFGVAWFGLLDLLTSVRRIDASIHAVPHVRLVPGPGPRLIECVKTPRPFVEAPPARPSLPPEVPAIEIPYWDVAFPAAELEAIDLDPSDIVTLS
jgi:hypothetical protein